MVVNKGTDTRQIKYYTSRSDFPSTGSSSYRYYAIDTHKYYEWAGYSYREIGSGNSIKAAEICTSINASGETQAVINANKIYLLGETIANKITADYISSKIADIPVLNARSLSVTGTISCGGYVYGDNFVIGSSTGGPNNQYVTNAITELQFTTSGTTVTLQKKDFADSSWVDVGSFSRATALSGAWSGGKITVSANAGNVPDLVQEIRGDGGSRSGATVSIGIYAYTAQGILIGATGRTVDYVLTTHSQCASGLARYNNGSDGKVHLYAKSGDNYYDCGNHFWYWRDTNQNLTTYYD